MGVQVNKNINFDDPNLNVDSWSDEDMKEYLEYESKKIKENSFLIKERIKELREGINGKNI